MTSDHCPLLRAGGLVWRLPVDRDHARHPLKSRCGLLATTPLIAVCLAAGPAWAQSAGRCDAGVSAGVARAGGGGVGTASEIPSLRLENRIDETGGHYGFWIGCRLFRVVALEFAVPVFGVSHNAELSEFGDVFSSATTSPQLPMLVRVRVSPFRRGVEPYAVLGVGVLPNMDFDRFGPIVNIAAGLRVALGRKAFVQAEAGHFRATFRDHLFGETSSGLVEVDYRDPLRFTGVTAGLGVRFW